MPSGPTRTPGATVAGIGSYPRKFNLGTRPTTHALRFTFDPERTLVERIEATSVDALAAGMTIKDRARAILRGGARTLPDLAAEMDVDGEVLARTIRRYSGDRAKFTLFAKLPDGRFGLCDRGSR